MSTSLQLSRTALLWQLLSCFVVLLPHVFHLPYWVPVLVLGCLAWRYRVYGGKASFPHWLIRGALVILTGIAVLASYRTGGGISVTVTLLITGFGLKLLEIYKRRDALLVLYVGYLVAGANFLFDQTAAMALYVFFSVWILTAALLTTYQTQEYSFFFPLKRVSYLLLPAIPLMVVLFLTIPRIGPLWNVGLDKSAARTGLSDSMSPGEISRLTRSAEVAFRAGFQESPPSQSQLYWRVMVFPDFDGQVWKNRYRRAVRQPEVSFQSGGRYEYDVILEPNNKRYVPVLDLPQSWPVGIQRLSDMTLRAPSEQVLRQQYKFRSQLDYSLDAEAFLMDFERELALPEGNPKSVELALQWRAETDSAEAYVARLKAYFNRSFVYSLTPPRLSGDRVDQFLFNTQTGFCEHYAGATAFLLRAAGIPARIVTGYQGGEWNPYERYLLVRQYDAHAWVEAWIEGKGWVRIDPTSSVAPERVEQPADDLFSEQTGFLSDSPLMALGIKGSGFISQLRLRLEAFNYGWQVWVLNYHHQQSGLLQQLLGKMTMLKLALVLLLPFAIIILISVVMQVLAGRKPSEHSCDQAILSLSEKLAQLGLSRGNGETFRHYCLRLAEVQPHLLSDLKTLADQYDRIRYAREEDAQSRQAFINSVKKFTNQFLQSGHPV